MLSHLPLFPEQASTVAKDVDALFFFLCAVSAFFAALIAVLLVVFAVRYRRRSATDRPHAIEGALALELVWTIIPFGIAMVMFVWGASVFVRLQRPPDNALQVFAVGKQWMWKLQHIEGQREINELHVPVGRPVKVTMTSEDVIHSFYVPAFRIKQDAIPGRYTATWFEATKPGTYHLFCAEYCGTQHSGMIGSVIVMEPADYEGWLSGGVKQSLVSAGETLFQQLGCVTCHSGESGARGPALDGLFGKKVQMQSGDTIVVDEAYVRDSILNPQAKIVAGYQPIMPTFKGLVSEEGLLQLIAYLKGLGVGDQGPVRQESHS
ncbi:MAG: cytochrome c oxidase subunit II [Deltaproteobacteria bacterium]|nr:cytochrome c oxidase subunit II [Deltaproteobacteria bacterium]MBI3386568.1 cytochrome c oxidase subunit II [Deltaproteobacteria bacterium]